MSRSSGLLFRPLALPCLRRNVDVIPPTISLSRIADDHIANNRFRPLPDTESSAVKEFELCAIHINDCMNKNKLKMNTSETEFIMFASKAHLSKC
jgi:hypothetical protein